MKSLIFSGIALLITMAGAVADPIEGQWKTATGNLAEITTCGNAFCITLKSGRHAGKEVGRFSAQGGGAYTGTLGAPDSNNSIQARGSLNGNTLTVGGCMRDGQICQEQNWTRM